MPLGPAVSIREFRMEDYDRVMELWAEGRLPLKPQGRDSRGQIERQIGLPNVIFLVAEVEGRVVGTVMATHDGRKGWINRLSVDAKLRKQKIGSRLVAEAEARFEFLGLELYACLIEEGNAVSIALFESLGYTSRPDILYFSKRKYPGV